MKRLLSLLFVLAVVATAITLAPVRSAEASDPNCACGWTATPQTWGQGDTCDAALADLTAKARALAVCPDRSCGGHLVITVGCHWDSYSQKFQQDGYYYYGCWYCDIWP